MLKIFNKDKKVEQMDVITKNKSVNELVLEIHESFFTEVDKLLADAKISKSLDTDKQDLINKTERLKKLGFTTTKEVIEGDIEIKRLKDLKIENEAKKELFKAINYFSMKYPNYKFITEDSVKRICKKYGLVYGEVSRYKGIVPDENLKQIERFKIKDGDICYIKTIRTYRSWGSNSKDIIIDFKEFQSIQEESQYHSDYSVYVSSCPLEIAAPIKDFDISNMEVKDSKLMKMEIPDPVVLQPVFFEGKKHYLIVTAWGLEASDDLIVNEKMN